MALALSGSAATVKDLGVLTRRTGLVLEHCTNRTDCTSFEIHFYPSGDTNNGVSIGKTNQLLTLKDIPSSLPEGPVVMAVSSVHAGQDTRAVYSFTLKRPKLTQATMIVLDESTAPLPPETVVAAALFTPVLPPPLPPVFRTPPVPLPPELPSSTTARESYGEAMIRHYARERRGR